MDHYWLRSTVAEAVEKRAAAQDPWELYVVGSIVGVDPPRRVLEIGSASCGALWFWAQIADYRAQVASIDVSHHDVHEENLTDMPENQKLYMHLGDSRDERSRFDVQIFFGGEPIDFLFIDGDHSYEVSKSDYLMYEQLVRPGGWIGFHDVQSSYVEDGGSYRLWQELRHQFPRDHVQVQLRPEGGMGIGMLRKR